MPIDDEVLLQEFVAETRELLAQAERDLLSIEPMGATPDPEVLARILRAVHSVKGNAAYFGLSRIAELSHMMESVLMRARDNHLCPDTEIINALLRANDRIRSMIERTSEANAEVIEAELGALARYGEGTAPIATAGPTPPITDSPAAPEPAATDEGPRSGAVASWAEVPGMDEDRRKSMARRGLRLYQIFVLVADDLEAQGRSREEFLANLRSLAEIISITDQEPRPGAGPSLVGFVSSILDPRAAPLGFGLPSERVVEISIRGVAKEGANSASPASRPAAALEEAPEAAALGWRREETVRVKTKALDALMEMAGEMVLARNRLSRWLRDHLEGSQAADPVLHEMNAISANLQDQIMQMRLQPVGTLFSKFHRLVRDFSQRLGKSTDLVVKGGDVELDRTVLEGLSDPLTHLVRNCLDHGIEPPDEREQRGKPRRGTLSLHAYHEAGMVYIVVEDDGRGIDFERVRQRALTTRLVTRADLDRMSEKDLVELVFKRGFSTASVVTEVSGRGVGMDVVKSNIERLGGTVEITTQKGKGTILCLKLPLTLAIVASLIVEAGGERFVLPRVGLAEVLRLTPTEASRRIERVGGADVLRHRDRVLPLVRLASVLGLRRTLTLASTGAPVVDRRERLADRRAEETAPAEQIEQRRGRERRVSAESVQRILVLRCGDHVFGLLVEHVLDNEDIVVKPLSRFVRGNPCFAGATILGDGRVSMILDPAGIATHAGLSFDADAGARDSDRVQVRRAQEQQSLLIFSVGAEERLALPLAQVQRIEKFQAADIQHVGEREYLEHRGVLLPLVRLEKFLPVQAPAIEPELLYVLIPNASHHPVGLVAHRVIDAIETQVVVDREAVRAPGLIGSTVWDGRILLLVDVFKFLDAAGQALGHGTGEHWQARGLCGQSVLLVEDTAFYSFLVRDYLESMGLTVITAADGEEAWGVLGHAQVHAVVTDLAMPRLDGRGLLARIRESATLKELPVIAMTGVLADSGREAGSREGFNGHAAKLDRESLAVALQECLGEGAAP